MPDRQSAGAGGQLSAFARCVALVAITVTALSLPLRAQGFDVPITVSEALPAGVPGLNRTAEPLRFGLPFPQGSVPLVGGLPALRLDGADVAQFRALRLWHDGSVQWALIDTLVDVVNGEAATPLSVRLGSGSQGGAPIGSSAGAFLILDTGALSLAVPRAVSNEVAQVRLHGAQGPIDGTLALVVRDKFGDLLVPSQDHRVVLEENGTVRAVVRIDTELVRADGSSVIDITLRLTAWRGSAEIDAQLTVRNARLERAQHAQLASLDVEARFGNLATPYVRLATHDGHVTRELAAHEQAGLFMGYTSANTFHTDSKDYVPHLPRVDGSFNQFVFEGYAVLNNGALSYASNSRHAFPHHGWMDMAGDGAGVTVAIRDMAYLWPASLQAGGAGVARAELFPALNPAPYTFVWRQHESRHARFAFRAHSFLTAPNAHRISRRLDAPLAARATDYAWYDDSGVFGYDLLTIEEHNEAYALLGIDHEVVAKNPKFAILRYLGKTTTGSSNNHAQIEDRLAAQWLRHGHGGAYRKGLDVALWKTEWQVPRSDDFHDKDDPGPSNDDIPHTKRTFGDEEHRYREGMILAYYLTGDERFHEALFDEAEVLEGVNFYPQERSMWQSLRAQALLTNYTRSVPLRKVFISRMTQLLYKTIDIEREDGGFGWQDDLPGMGMRRYYVFSGDLNSEKPPGENFQTRGFVPTSLGPLALHNASLIVGPSSPFYPALRARLVDLAYWTRFELFPYKPNPADRRLPYSYAVTLQQVVSYENFDYHPILFGMAEAWRETGQTGYLIKGLEQLEAFEAHDEGSFANNLHLLDTRLDVQHFMSAVREVLAP